MFLVLKIVSYLLLVGIFSWLLYLYITLWFNSQRIRRKLRMQGVGGPPPSFLYGNLPDMRRIQSQALLETPSNHSDQFVAHDYTATLFPYFEHWKKKYGNLTSVCWVGKYFSLKIFSWLLSRYRKLSINSILLAISYV